MFCTIPPSTLHLASQAAALRLGNTASADAATVLRTTDAFVGGFCVGYAREAFQTLPTLSAPGGWDAFLRQVRSKELNSNGKTNPGVLECADAFVAGALEVFPEADGKIFLRTLSRLWGFKMSPSRAPLKAPVSDEKLETSREMGRTGGVRLKQDYGTGRLAGFSRTVLDNKLHIRDVDDYVRACGWLMGTVAAFGDAASEERDLLKLNHDSLLHRAFHAGRPSFPREAATALPDMLGFLDVETKRWETADPDAAAALRANRATVIGRAFHAGDLTYPATVVTELPSMLRTLDAAIARFPASDAEVARMLRASRASIVSRALNRGNFQYPALAIAIVPEALGTIDREIERLNPDVSKTARILEAHRATIVMHTVSSGDFGFAEKVVKKLPRLRKDLETTIEQLRKTDAVAADFLSANRKTAIDRVLNTGDWTYPAKIAAALPALWRSFPEKDRTEGVHDAIVNAALRPRRKTRKR